MNVNSAGLNLIKSFESCRLKAYFDQVGKVTVGWGHTGPDVSINEIITQSRADSLLGSDLAKFQKGVRNLLTVNLNGNQFSALVSFAYNVGLGNFQHSQVLKFINANDFDTAMQHLLKWDEADGVASEGLLRRREAEKALFETPEVV